MVKTEVASSPEAEYDPADVKAAVKEEGAGDASVKLETTRSESHSVKTEAEEEEEEENEDEEEAEAEVDQEDSARFACIRPFHPAVPSDLTRSHCN